MVDDLARISGLSVTELNETIETIRPYRIIEVADAERGRRLDVISEEVRNALRAGFKKGEKERIHRSFIEYLSQNPGDNVDYFEVMGWHYKELGRVRDSLLMSVRAIALARKDRDPFALRQYCRSEIAYIRNMSRPRSVVDTWLIERYFIKQWINAEWMVANYRNLVGVIDEHLIHRKRQVPASFLYKYAMALERIGKPERCRKVLGDGERRLAPARSETYYMLLLQDARMLCHAGMCEQSLERLDAINRDVLAPVARARLFVTYVHDYQELGQEDRWVEYIEKADRLPRVPGLIDELLRVEYSKIRRMLTKGVYGPTIKMIRNGIRVAAKYRAKRSMCSMYFIASALYYESGDYRRAIKFLDKAIHVGKENVFPEWTYEWVLRYAYIYRQLGLYGNAVEKVESVTRAVGTDRGHLQYLSSLTALLELFVMINSVRAEEVFPEVVRAARKVQSQMRLAFYHRALARYYAKKSDIDRAISEFETARKLFSMTKMIDEEVSAGIAIASLLIAQNRLESANQFLHDLKPFCERIESKKIQAEFSILELKYCVAGGVEQRRIEHCIERCEKLRSQTRDVTLSMAIDAELFAALARIGNLVRASEVFDRYYGELRYIVGNLPGEYVGDFVRDPRLIAIIESYRHLKTQDPGRRY
jgi:tetratricopeptide (TPR) repeat protein